LDAAGPFALSAALPAAVEPPDVLAPVDFAAAAALVLRDGLAAGALVAVAAGLRLVPVFAVADL
jgi:hypothetical protein